MTRIAIIDHGAGNLVSIERALCNLGASTVLCAEPKQVTDVDGVVLPGVGATGAAMDRLVREGLDAAIRDWEGPLLAICVGLQLLFDTSEEGDGRCLGLVPGRVTALPGRPLPHMGWNDVDHAGDPLFAGIPSRTTFSFLHSYAAVPDDPQIVIGSSEHGTKFAAAIRAGTRIGVQFHPERSAGAGSRLLGNFLAECKEASRAA